LTKKSNNGEKWSKRGPKGGSENLTPGGSKRALFGPFRAYFNRDLQVLEGRGSKTPLGGQKGGFCPKLQGGLKCPKKAKKRQKNRVFI